MSSRYTKYNNNVTCETVDNIYNMLPSENKIKIKCEYCKNEVEQPTSYVVYTFNDKKFCSYRCKQKYIKEHPKEEELSDSEHKAKEYSKLQRDSAKRYMEKYYEERKKRKK